MMNRADMCQTGKYRERGIRGLDGYQTEFVVDHEQYIVQVPAELEPVGVLMEPLSVVEKAIDEALRVQTVRCPDAATIPDWLHGRRCLVAGSGPVGLLAAMVLVLRGGEVYGLDVVDGNTARPKWLEGIGGHYIDGRQAPADRVEKKIGGMDFILDATGIAQLEFNLLDALALNGMYVLTGIPGGDRPLQIPGAELIRQLVLDNQVMLGSVNAARGHFQIGAEAGDLFMSLIHTCELAGANPFDYLAELQKHPAELASNPSAWMPWNYAEMLARGGLSRILHGRKG